MKNLHIVLVLLFVFAMQTLSPMKCDGTHQKSHFDDVGEVSASIGQLDPYIFKGPHNLFEIYTGKYFTAVRESNIQGEEDLSWSLFQNAPKDRIYPCCACMAYQLLKNKYQEQLKNPK